MLGQMSPSSGLALAKATPPENRGSGQGVPDLVLPEERAVGTDVPACLCCRLSRGSRAGPGNPRGTEENGGQCRVGTTLETVSWNAGAVETVPGGAAAETRLLRAWSATGSPGAAGESIGNADPRALLAASCASARPSNGAFVCLAEDGLHVEAERRGQGEGGSATGGPVCLQGLVFIPCPMLSWSEQPERQRRQPDNSASRQP